MPLEELFDELPSDWDYITLGEACSRGGGGVQTGPFGSQLHAADYVAEGIPSIMPLNIGENRVVEDRIARITPKDAARLNRYLVQKGDIVYSRRGDVERRALIRDQEDGWLCGTGCLRVRLGEKGGNPTYASYYLGHPAVREWIVRHAQGATMPNLNTSILSALPFVYPPLPEQRAIASVLGSLDDKIELNRRINKTLEALAQSLFKSWFVDATQSALPKGWREGKVSDLATLGRDGLNPGEFPNETFDHYSLPAFDEGRTPKPEKGDTIRSNKFIVPPNCVMVSKLNPRIPRIWLPDLRGQNRAVCSAEFLVATPKPGVSREFLYCLFINESFVSVFTTMVTGTSGSHQRVPPESLLNMDTPLPPKPLIQKFTDTVAPMLKRISKNIQESRTLAELRDALLPKLLSGEIRVSEAEGEVHRHA